MANRFLTVLDRPGTKIFLGFLAVGLAYVFGSWAIDSGSLWDYAITVLLIVAGIREWADVYRAKKAAAKKAVK